ncbi:MAG: zinc ribbon domain-containing protein [Puniceicoccales bacterium]|jgi:rubredoxin|nr:zinc ribbon domain-containing protein [Puniceicoccales bacterium]
MDWPMGNIETSLNLLLFIGVSGIFLLWVCCDRQDNVRLRLHWKHSAFLCRRCRHIYEAMRPPKSREGVPCPHCGTENTPLHF